MKKNQIKRVRTYYFTLLEVIISLILATIVMGVLLFYYFQMSQTSRISDQASVQAFKIRYLENRLHDLSLRVTEPNDKGNMLFTGNATSGLFLPGTQNLIFSYFNGTIYNNPLSSDVLGRLFVDPEKNLTLITWEGRNSWKEDSFPEFHKEILLDDVSEFTIKFFVGSKTDIELASLTRDEVKQPKWLDFWMKDFQELPAIIRFNITANNKKYTYDFPLVGKYTKIIYKS